MPEAFLAKVISVESASWIEFDTELHAHLSRPWLLKSCLFLCSMIQTLGGLQNCQKWLELCLHVPRWGPAVYKR